MSQYVVTDTELTAVANAIRAKLGSSDSLEWPSGFADAIGDISGGGGPTSSVQGFDLYCANFEGYTQSVKGIYDNVYFTCFFHDNLSSSSYTLNGNTYTFTTYISGKNGATISGDCKEITSNPVSSEPNAMISKKGSEFTVVHGDSGSWINVIGGWVGYPKSGTIYQNGTYGSTNSIVLNSAHNKLLIFVGGSNTYLQNCSSIDINGTTYQVTNIGSRYDSMYGIYTAIEIDNNSDTTITVTFPNDCYNYVSIVGID